MVGVLWVSPKPPQEGYSQKKDRSYGPHVSRVIETPASIDMPSLPLLLRGPPQSQPRLANPVVSPLANTALSAAHAAIVENPKSGIITLYRTSRTGLP